MNHEFGNRRGFTLVEMLVSVTLVLLMMSMFAAIFQLAGETTSTQKGIAVLDQSARAITNTIRTDLDKRTFRNVMAFQANENGNATATRFDDRLGFFQIVTNDPNNGLDDTLLFTVSADMVQKNPDKTPYFGHAEQVFDPADAIGDGHNRLVFNPNQPEMDDDVIISNSTGRSSTAQIAYFVRNGNLYRRVLLVRQPRERAGRELNPQPSFESGLDPFDVDGDPSTPAYVTPDSAAVGGTDAFFRDFDYSAIRATGTNLAQFLGEESLNNAPGSTFFTLAKPQNRFGHSPSFTAGVWSGGFPRLYDIQPNGANTPEFMGFFLHEETSYDGTDDMSTSPPTLIGGFNFPQGNARRRGSALVIGDSVNPVSPFPAFASLNEQGDPTDIRIPLTLNDQKVVTEFVGGSRRAEDLLLSDVHEFRIEIWDDRLGDWTYPGHTRSAGGALGDYHLLRRYNHNFGPFGPGGFARTTDAPGPALQWNYTNQVFDTWHPDAEAGDLSSAATNFGMPPFRSMTFYPPTRPLGTMESETIDFWAPSTIDWTDHSNSVWQVYETEDDNGNGVLDPGEDDNTNGVLDVPYVFARTEDLNGDGDADDTDEDGWYSSTMNGELDSEAPFTPFGYAYCYKLVRSGVASDPADIGRGPNWQARRGALITEEFSQPLPAGIQPAVWEAVPNLRPLRAIRITVRFVDASSGKMRQSTIVHSLID